MKMTCVFEGCKKPTTNGVCDEHTIDAVAVVRGEEPRCPHNRLWSEDCRDCQRESAGRALFDANVAAMLARGIESLSVSVKRYDAALRFLQVELTRADIPSTLGPNGGVPIATFLGVSAADGRMCRVDVDSAKAAVDGGGLVAMSVHWGDRELLTAAGGATAEVVGALTTYFVGVKERAKVLR